MVPTVVFGRIPLRLDMTESERAVLSSGALLHDIGKLAVPEGVLFKPGRLTVSQM